jgi:hypothetical protein
MIIDLSGVLLVFTVILRRIGGDIIINVRGVSWEVTVILARF